MKAYLIAKLAEFTDWACWKAWHYAARREHARRKAVFGGTRTERTDLTPDQRRIAANEARQVLENRHYVDAWNAVNEHLEAVTLRTDPYTREGADSAARIVIAKQLLLAVRRELERKAEDGYMAEVELDEINRRNRPVRFMR